MATPCELERNIADLPITQADPCLMAANDRDQSGCSGGALPGGLDPTAAQTVNVVANFEHAAVATCRAEQLPLRKVH